MCQATTVLHCRYFTRDYIFKNSLLFCKKFCWKERIVVRCKTTTNTCRNATETKKTQVCHRSSLSGLSAICVCMCVCVCMWEGAGISCLSGVCFILLGFFWGFLFWHFFFSRWDEKVLSSYLGTEGFKFCQQFGRVMFFIFFLIHRALHISRPFRLRMFRSFTSYIS